MEPVKVELEIERVDQLLMLGDLDNAECVLRDLDTLNQRSSDVLGRLGWIMQQRGRQLEAIDFFEAALALNPDQWPSWSSLAVSLERLERIPESIAALCRAVELEPDMPDLRLHLATLHEKMGDIAAAESVLRLGLTRCPMSVGLWNNLAILLERNGQRAEAIHAYESALALDPDSSDIRFNLALTLHAIGRTREALGHYDALPETHRQLPLYRLHRAQALAAQFLLSEAIAEYRELLKLEPNHMLAWNNLGSALHDSGEYREARVAFNHALALDPVCRQARYNLALVDLTEGDFEAGWAGYEARDTVPLRPEPRWRGEKLQGETVAVIAEQGMGDIIQFIRFVPWLVERGGRVVLVCSRKLHRLLEGFPGLSGLVGSGEGVEGARWSVPLMSLAGWAGAREGTIPYVAGYLGKNLRDHETTQITNTLIAYKKPPLRIGVVWKGNPLHAKDRFRSLSLHQLAGLFSETRDLPVQWSSLQCDLSEEERDCLRSYRVDISPQMEDWADTADWVAGVDLVISVDTAMVHLAGALGKPVWVLLPYVPDWRWQLDRRDSFWYASARLFRQGTQSAWGPVLRQVEGELREVFSRGA
jgi:Flp pilus assembly protein TadD